MLALQIIILGFCLPYSIILISRWLFAFYWPMNLGNNFSYIQKRTPDHPSFEAIRLFFFFNSALFVLSFLLFSFLVYLPFINAFFSFALDSSILYSLLYILSSIYIAWFLSLFSFGYLFGQDFYDKMCDPRLRSTFYYLDLDQAYNYYSKIFERLATNLRMLFDDEKAANERMEIHKSLVDEFTKDGEKDRVDLMKSVLKLDEEDIKRVKMLEKKGKPYLLWDNFKREIWRILEFPIDPAISFFLLLAAIISNLFPPLREELNNRNT